MKTCIEPDWGFWMEHAMEVLQEVDEPWLEFPRWATQWRWRRRRPLPCARSGMGLHPLWPGLVRSPPRLHRHCISHARLLPLGLAMLLN